MEKIFFASDHAAFKERCDLARHLEHRFEVIDLGTSSEASCHYPDYAIALARKMQQDAQARGVLLCGSGIGVSIVANRFKGIRAALCRSVEDAGLSRLHNDANVLCLGSRATSIDEMKRILDVWLSTSFEAGRHRDRLDIFKNLGE